MNSALKNGTNGNVPKQVRNNIATNIHCQASIHKFGGYKLTTQVRMGKYK